VIYVSRYISILPTIHLSLIIPPEEAIQLRVPGYKATWTKKPKVETNTKKVEQKVPEKTTKELEIGEKANNDKTTPDTLKMGVTVENKDSKDTNVVPGRSEPDFLTEDYIRKYYPYIDLEQIRQFYPKSRFEFIVTVSLGFLSVICITYFIMVLYRCMCSKKYSKWRASWNRVPKNKGKHMYYKQIKEALPIVLRGHLQVCI